MADDSGSSIPEKVKFADILKTGPITAASGEETCWIYASLSDRELRRK